MFRIISQSQFSEVFYPENSYCEVSGQKLTATKWMTLHEKEVMSGMSIFHKMMGVLVLNNPSATLAQVQSKFDVHIMNSLHNKHKTEVFLNSCRYMVMNLVSEFSNYQELIPDLAFKAKDQYQIYL